ncbi:hypothetical protein C8F01DRAFT_1108200 [Mycena amicta]|nr:hypothetical protein C8F01DRAFT_1108200 [Mycena amicta]
MRRGIIRVARLTRSLHESRLDRLLTPLRHPHEPNAVRSHYLPLVEELHRNPASEPVLSRKQLMTIIDLLATSGRPADLECIRSMCSHLPTYFGVPVTPELHTVVIAALLRQGYLPLAQDWIRNIPELPPHVPPTLEHYHTFLRSCPQHVQPVFLREVVTQRMRRSGVRPDSETFSLLVRCIINNSAFTKLLVHRDCFHGIIADMKMHRVSPDPSILSAITQYYIEHGFAAYAEELQGTYASHFPDAPTPEEEQRLALNKRLAAMPGFNRALRTYTRLVHTGFATATTPDAIRAILNSSRDIQDLRRVESVLGVKADASAYAVLVNNNIRVRELNDALAVYSAAKEAGIVPVAGLVSPIIRSLCSNDQKRAAVHNAHLDTALTLYADIDEAHPAPEEGSPEALAVQDHSAHSHGPDVDIYTCLLRGLGLSSNIKTAYPVGVSLLSDMKLRNIPPTQAIRTSKIILDMRSCATLDDAYNVYNKSRSELTDSSYLVVLHAFSRMSHSMGHPDMLQYYFQIVQDMRQAGFRITDRVYTDILQQFAEMAGLRKKQWKWSHTKDPLNPLPPNMFADLEAAVRQVHNILSLDTTIQPERLRVVWNQLMDTYQRLGNFAEAFRVWETMFHTEKYGSISVSIILDACGYAGEFNVAKQIVNNLRAQGFVLTLHNWNSYIECLCRLHQFGRALEVLCYDMGTISQPVKPDVSTVSIMVKLAQTRIQTNIVLQRVRRFLPDLWTEWESMQKKEPDRPP